MTAHSVTATQLKNHLGAYLDAAIAAPVFVQKSGRNVAVLVSQAYYTQLQALEDELWALRAILAEQSGYLGVAETAQVLNVKRRPEDGSTC